MTFFPQTPCLFIRPQSCGPVLELVLLDTSLICAGTKGNLTKNISGDTLPQKITGELVRLNPPLALHATPSVQIRATSFTPSPYNGLHWVLGRFGIYEQDWFVKKVHVGFHKTIVGGIAAAGGLHNAHLLAGHRKETPAPTNHNHTVA